jgi:deoxyadenosine kinase
VSNAFDIHQAAMEGVFIGISGLIGAGKTTLATALAKKLKLPVYYEPVVDNEYLADFYRETKKYSFNMQIYLLNARFKQQQQIIWQGKGGVQDRTIYEDSIFARMLCESGLMDERDYRTYLNLFQNMSNFMKKPNIIVHLDVSPGESLRRIKLRNRDCESSISLEYLTNLYKAYELFLKDINRIIPVIKVDYERFRTADEMAEAIAQHYYNMCNIRNVSFDDDKEGKGSLLFEPDEPSEPSSAAPSAPPSPTKKTPVDGDIPDSPPKSQIRKKKKPKQEEGEPKAAEPKRLGFDGI